MRKGNAIDESTVCFMVRYLKIEKWIEKYQNMQIPCCKEQIFVKGSKSVFWSLIAWKWMSDMSGKTKINTVWIVYLEMCNKTRRDNNAWMDECSLNTKGRNQYERSNRNGFKIQKIKLLSIFLSLTLSKILRVSQLKGWSTSILSCTDINWYSKDSP